MSQEWIIALARRCYATDGGEHCIEIDDNAKIAPAHEGGSWVQAWVYLSNEILDEHEPVEERR